MSEALQVVQPESTTLLAVIANAAKDPNTDVAKMERLLDMYERVSARDAEVAFNEAMNKVQAGLKRISADLYNPQTRSRYASYAALDRVLRPVYTEHGFSLSFDTGESAPDTVLVLCHVSHSAGHTRLYRATMPADGKGAKGGDVMTRTHAAGAGMSYGMRYLLKMIFNVAIGEDDNDGNMGDDGAADWLAAIEAASDVEELRSIRERIVAANLVGHARAKVTAAWNARKKALMP